MPHWVREYTDHGHRSLRPKDRQDCRDNSGRDREPFLHLYRELAR